MENYSNFYNAENVEVVNNIPEEVSEQEDQIIFAKVKSDRLYLREEPSKDSKPITVLKNGKELMIDQPIDPDSEWVHVCTEESLEGYVMKFFISL